MMEASILEGKREIRQGLVIGVLVALLYWFGSPVMLMVDTNDEQCLENAKYSVLLRWTALELKAGDHVFWKPSGSLAFVKQSFILKRVAGVPGDRLRIADGKVFINDKVVVQGFPLSQSVYAADARSFERDEIIPSGSIFLIGTHPRSNDSRYWGYLPLTEVRGLGYPIY